MKLKNDKISGADVEVEVSSHGWFTVSAAGATARLGQGETLEAAIAQARANIAKRKVKVSVPFRTANGDGVAYGLHAGNGSVLARIGGEAVQMDFGLMRKVLSADMPDDRMDRLVEVLAQIRDLEVEKREIEEAYKFDLKKAVEQAVEEAQSA